MGVQLALISILLLAGFFVLLFGSFCSNGTSTRTPGSDVSSNSTFSAPASSNPTPEENAIPLSPPEPHSGTPMIPHIRRGIQPTEVSHQEQLLLLAINEARRNQGLHPLAVDASLMNVARVWAAYLGPTRSIFHRTSSDLEAQRARCQLSLISENLFASSGSFDPEEVVVGWLNSPPHRKALLDPSTTLQGVGLAPMEGGGYVAVFNGGN